MSERVTQYRDGRPRASTVVSPELALVDPELAAAERERLPAIATWKPLRTGSSRGVGVAAGSTAQTHPARAATRDRVMRRTMHSRRGLAGIATATALILLLLDVRVEVGRSPASAERQPSTSSPSVVGGSPSPTPATPRRPRSPLPRRFAWAPVAGADAYDVELFLGAQRVLSRRTTTPQLDIPPSWQYLGRRFTLVRGTYRWYVWAVASGKRAATAVVQSRLVVSAP